MFSNFSLFLVCGGTGQTPQNVRERVEVVFLIVLASVIMARKYFSHVTGLFCLYLPLLSFSLSLIFCSRGLYSVYFSLKHNGSNYLIFNIDLLTFFLNPVIASTFCPLTPIMECTFSWRAIKGAQLTTGSNCVRSWTVRSALPGTEI